MKILVIVLSGIGDALMFTPSLLMLRDKFPSAEIEALVMFKGVKDIYENIPQISKVHFWDFLNRKKIDSLFYTLKLRKKYDISINVYPSNRKEYNLISLLIRAEKRAAIRYLRKDFSNLGFLNNACSIENDSLHNVEENIKLCELLTGTKIKDIPPLQLILGNEDRLYAQDFLIQNKINESDLVIGFHPGCSALKNHDKRRWEAERFAQLGKNLISNHNAKILVFGGPEEQNLKETIRLLIQSPDVWEVNTKSLLNAAAVMNRCNIFVSNDSSLMHVAAALKLNVVAIIGPTNKNYIYPWKTNYKIVSLDLDCSPCFYYSPKPLTCNRSDIKFKCIKELEVELVYEKVRMFMKERDSNITTA